MARAYAFHADGSTEAEKWVEDREGACRDLVQDRMGRTGARWALSGAEATLRLRALRASGDFDDYWQFHLAKEHERTHQSGYADGVVPNSLPRTRPNLRLVE